MCVEHVRDAFNLTVSRIFRFCFIYIYNKVELHSNNFLSVLIEKSSSLREKLSRRKLLQVFVGLINHVNWVFVNLGSLFLFESLFIFISLIYISFWFYLE